MRHALHVYDTRTYTRRTCMIFSGARTRRETERERGGRGIGRGDAHKWHTRISQRGGHGEANGERGKPRGKAKGEAKGDRTKGDQATSHPLV